jgi:hypothetical protein
MKSFVVASVLCIFFAGCKEKSSTGAKPSEVEMLIEQLASPNRPVNPERQRGPERFPEGYDMEAQERVELAVERLKSLGKQAFPLLIANWKDARYCRSYPIAIWEDFTVGQTCLEILGGQVAHFDERRGYKGMPYYSYSVINKDPEGWWREHSEMTIEAMRLEALQWIIDAERMKMEQRDDKVYQAYGMSRSEWAETYIDPLEKLMAEQQKRQAEQGTAGNPRPASP